MPSAPSTIAHPHTYILAICQNDVQMIKSHSSEQSTRRQEAEQFDGPNARSESAPTSSDKERERDSATTSKDSRQLAHLGLVDALDGDTIPGARSVASMHAHSYQPSEPLIM